VPIIMVRQRLAALPSTSAVPKPGACGDFRSPDAFSGHRIGIALTLHEHAARVWRKFVRELQVHRVARRWQVTFLTAAVGRDDHFRMIRASAASLRRADDSRDGGRRARRGHADQTLEWQRLDGNGRCGNRIPLT
jgi:hypothetical protein